jgi:hypothetical protein
MARKPNNYHYIYKTTCTITNKYYIGMHSCSNLDDGYLGSGKRLGYSVRKYGKESHIKEILEFCEDRISLAIRESEIVDLILIEDPLCMNLKPGGNGGFSSIEHQFKCSSAAGLKHSHRMKTDEEYSKSFKNRVGEVNTLTKRGFCSKPLDWTGKTHTEETKNKMSESKKGTGTKEKNSQYGTMWITNEIENRKINKSDSIPDGYRKGRLMN